MSTLLLVRHGLTAMTGPVLAGHTPTCTSTSAASKQAAAVAARIAVLPMSTIVTSSLDRCVETAEAIRAAQRAAGREPGLARRRRHRRVPLRRLDRPAAEGAGQGSDVEDRAGPAVGGALSRRREPDRGLGPRRRRRSASWDARLGEDAIWVACSHGDVIKAILADALGLHLDQFQRIAVDPCSVSVVRYTAARPYVLRSNDVGGDLAAFAPPKRRRRRGAATTRPSAAERAAAQV